jgi:hypothetical protein
MYSWLAEGIIGQMGQQRADGSDDTDEAGQLRYGSGKAEM